MNQGEAHVLAHLHEVGPASIGALHEAFAHRRPTLTGILDRLEERGLVRRALRHEGGDRVSRAIRRFVDLHAPGKYHETITRAWVQLVWAALHEGGHDEGFDAFWHAHPDLADKDRLLTFYRPQALASDAARRAWVEPDRQPLP